MTDYHVISYKTIYTVSEDLEAILACLYLLQDEEAFLALNLYSKTQIDGWKRQYRFLFETFHAVSDLTGLSILDFLLDGMSEELSLDLLQTRITSLNKAERMYRLVDWPYDYDISSETILKSLSDDSILNDLFLAVQERCSNFLGFSCFLRENNRFLNEFFDLSRELLNDVLREKLTASEKQFLTFKNNLIQELQNENSFEVSQRMMGKTFKNTGPYDYYYFVPTLFLPGKCVRLFDTDGTFHNKQILIYNISQSNTVSLLPVLKTISDETRYQILKLLLGTSPLNSKELSRELKLAPSTVSHHISLLKDVGLINEEPVKNSKYYSISETKMKEVLKKLFEDFSIDLEI
ncbi:ArsR/SmtB family transcription factor [Streptococcus cameli]